MVFFICEAVNPPSPGFQLLSSLVMMDAHCPLSSPDSSKVTGGLWQKRFVMKEHSIAVSDVRKHHISTFGKSFLNPVNQPESVSVMHLTNCVGRRD